MSSLAAVQADGFYYPPDFDPNKHVSLNKYHGTHALRERAAKLGQGILVIRFEVPFHIWCSKCGEKIAKGERFNADKKAIGMYHSTKIWQFSMRHHCGCVITIQTDPKNTEYIVVEGARRKIEGTHTASDDEVIELPDDDEKERLARDALYRLEKGEASRKRARTAAEEVAMLLEDAHDKHSDPYATNARLRAKMRVVRKEVQALQKEHKALNLPEEVQLLPASTDDTVAAQLAFYTHDSTQGTAHTEQRQRRQEILAEPIFPIKQKAHTQNADEHRRHKDRPAAQPHTGARRAQEAQTVTSKERSDSGHDDEHLQDHNLSSDRSRHHHHKSSHRHHRESTGGHIRHEPGGNRGSTGGHIRHEPGGKGKRDVHSAGHSHQQSTLKAMVVPSGQVDGPGRQLSESDARGQQPLEVDGPGQQELGEETVEGSKGSELAVRAPAEQPGAASGVVQGSTAEAGQKRRVGLQAVHASARSAVAAWRAARQPVAGDKAAAAAQQPAGKRGGNSSKLPAGVVKKAQMLAMRQKLQGGVGFQIPGRLSL